MNFRKIYLLLFSIVFVLTGCGNEPVFTEMSTNRLKIVIKGTFETEDSSRFPTMESQLVNTSPMQDDSVDEVTAGSDDALPTTIMIDIAEIRLGGKKISNYRQVFEIPLDDSHPFFNGAGIELKTDDPGDGLYDSVQLYVRKMIFDNAKVYQSTGSGFTYEKDLEVIFHEQYRYGFNFNQLMVNSYWDSLRLEGGDIVRVFPMHIPIVGGLSYSRENDETVLEIRLVIKNFVKKYEYDYYDTGIYKVCHYYAPSDWLRDVRAGEKNIGRNLHAVARSYVPGKTASSVTVSAAAGYYVVAIPDSEQISDYYTTSDGATIRNSVIGDMPLPPSYPGSYIEAVLEYYLKYEKYKNGWNTERSNLASESASGFTDLFDKYEYYWDQYESAVKGDGFGLKIAPYVAYSTAGTVVLIIWLPEHICFIGLQCRLTASFF